MVLKTKNKIELKKVPKLRFPGFSGEWENRKLKNTSSFFSGGTPISTNKKFYFGTIPFIKSGELNAIKTDQFITEEAIESSSAKMVEVGDLLYALYGATSGSVGISKIKGAINQAVLCIRTKEDKIWLYNYLFFKKNSILSRYLQGGQGNLSADIIKNLLITFPSVEEQKKIAAFFGVVDEWLANLRKQKELLQKYKKGLMQKIFTQSLRFKDKNGNPFPDWEEKKIEELGNSYSGLSGKSGDDFGEGEPFVTYKQIFDSSEIDINKFGFVRIGSSEKQNRSRFGDIFFTTSSETPEEVGFASVLLDKHANPFLNSFSFAFRINSFEILDPYFAKFLFRNLGFRKLVIKLAQGSTRYNISKLEFMKIKIFIPFLPEQRKITELFIGIDNILKVKSEEIQKVENWKKGLMQELFV